MEKDIKEEIRELKTVFNDIRDILGMLYQYFHRNQVMFTETKDHCEKLLEQLEKTKTSFYKSLPKKPALKEKKVMVYSDVIKR